MSHSMTWLTRPYPARILMRLMRGLAVAAMLAGCGGGSDSGGGGAVVDLTGVWVGTYGIASGQTGSVVINLVQSGHTLAGQFGAVGGGIADGNIGPRIEGTVVGHHASGHPVSSPGSAIEADEANGTLTGTLLVAAGISANWSAQRVPTYALRIAATRTLLPGVQLPKFLAAQGGTLWFFDEYDTRVRQNDGNGAVTQEISIRCNQGFERCGTGFVCSDGKTLTAITPSGANWAVTPLNGSLRASVATCDAASPPGIWARRLDAPAQPGYSIVAQADPAGVANGKIVKVPGTIDGGLTFDGTDLWAMQGNVRVLLRLSTAAGAPQPVLAAYRLPEKIGTVGMISGLTWDGGALWMLWMDPAAPPQPPPIQYPYVAVKLAW